MPQANISWPQQTLHPFKCFHKIHTPAATAFGPWYSPAEPHFAKPLELLHQLSSMSNKKLLEEHLSVSNNGCLHVTQLLSLASDYQHSPARETIALAEPLTSSQLLQLCKWYQNLPSPQTDSTSRAELAKLKDRITPQVNFFQQSAKER